MSDFKFTQDYVVYKTKTEAIYPIKESDWNRLKKIIVRIIPQSRFFQITASIGFGIFGSAIFALIAFNSAKELDAWVLPTTWVIFFVSLIGGIGFLILDKFQKKMITHSTEYVLSEMSEIEKSYDGPEIAEKKDKEEDKLNTFAIEDWRATTDRLSPQWAAHKEINLKGHKLKSIRCTVNLKTDYLRFGFRLLDSNSALFGQKGILNNANTALTNISKGPDQNKLSSTFYISEKSVGKPVQLGDYQQGDLIDTELLIDKDNNLEYKVNGKLAWAARVDPGIRERVFLMAWGDKEYDMEIKDIVVTTVPL